MNSKEIVGSKSEKISRRQFLIASAKGVRSLALLASLDALGLNNLKTDTVEDRFLKLGLEDWLPFYIVASDFLAFYRQTPTYVDSLSYSNPHHDLFLIIQMVASGNKLDKEILTIMSESWGSRLDRRSDFAEHKIQNVQIIIDPGCTDTEESVRTYLLKIARLFPYHIIIAPNKFRVMAGGGHYLAHGHSLSTDPYYNQPVIAFTSPTMDPEQAAVSLIHELAHADQAKWRDGHQYVDKKAYVNYLVVKTTLIRYLTDLYFSLSWEDAAKFGCGSPLIMFHNNFTAEQIEEEEKKFSQEFQINDFPQDPSLTLGAGYNRLIHALGKRYCLLRKKEKEQGKKALTINESNFIYTYSFQWVSQVIKELDHYLCGPVQRIHRGGGLPTDHNDVDITTGGVLTKANILIQQARLNACSKLSAEDISDPNRMFQELRKRLGLPKDINA